ncbi:RING finger protein 228 [Liasis olivaceus]
MAKEEQHSGDQTNGLKGGTQPVQDGEKEGVGEEPTKGEGFLPPTKTDAPLTSEEYECRICYNLFDLERHAPKLLECLHTFCRECLSELHLRGDHSPHCRADSGGNISGYGATELADGGRSSGTCITCPVCRHCTALPEGQVHRLPVNTKLVEAILLQLRGWAPLLPELRPQRLLLQVPRPSRQRSCSEQSIGAETPSATVSVRSVEVETCVEELGGGGGGACGGNCRKKASCLCFVFAVLAMALLGFAWMEWLNGSIFLGVALLLLFASTMPFMYNFRIRSEPRTIFFTRAGGSDPREGPSCRSTPGGSRSAVDGRSRC